MVSAKLALDAVRRLNIRIRRHNTSIVNQHVNPIHQPINLLRTLTHRLQIIEVEFDESRIGAGTDCLDRSDHGRDLGFRTAGQEKLRGMAVGEGEAGLFAEAAFAGARDDDCGPFLSARVLGVSDQ